MAQILKFPGSKAENTGHFGVRLDEVFRAVVHYVVVEDDQVSADHLLNEVAALDALEEYVGLPCEVRHIIRGVPGLEHV